jgi:hypothetical protein
MGNREVYMGRGESHTLLGPMYPFYRLYMWNVTTVTRIAEFAGTDAYRQCNTKDYVV